MTIWALRFFCSFKRRSPSAAARRSAAHTESPHEMFFRQRKALSPKLKSFGLADFYWARDKLQMLCGPGALRAHHFYGACDLNRPFFLVAVLMPGDSASESGRDTEELLSCHSAPLSPPPLTPVQAPMPTAPQESCCCGNQTEQTRRELKFEVNYPLLYYSL